MSDCRGLETVFEAHGVAALRVAERLGPKATVVAIIVDSGIRYLSTDVFRSAGTA
jgi:cysteine synthase A